MILRTVRGRFAAAGQDADALVELRGGLSRAARSVDGLESLIVGARREEDMASPPMHADDPRIEAAIVTVWRDVDAMSRATAIDEGTRLFGSRLDLPFHIERMEYHEVVGRTFAALPPEASALLRILRVAAGPNDEARLVETLRSQQPRLVELGLVASHLGRRALERGQVEAMHVSVWPDRATIRAATRGHPELPLFAAELEPWADSLRLEMYDGIEIAPQLPSLSGPPLLILDERLRIVDITATASALLGLPAADLVGRAVDRLAMVDAGPDEVGWHTLLADGELTGETAWSVPAIGHAILRFAALRDAPVAGRHAVLVGRHHDPVPSLAELKAVLAEAFPTR